jgi:hypothetical protein
MYIYNYIYCLLQDVVINKVNISCRVRSFEWYIFKTMAVIISNFRASFFGELGEYEVQSVDMFWHQCQVYSKFLLWCLRKTGYVWAGNTYRMRSFYAPKTVNMGNVPCSFSALL